VLRFDLTRREDYGLYLNVHHAALESIQDSWRREDGEDFLAMTRRLQRDLGDLGIAIGSLKPGDRRPIPDPGRWGLAYVVRGSRLSAGELRRRVSAQFATSYLEFSPKVTWGQFLAQLDAVAENRENQERIIEGARETLAVFLDLLMQAVA
jgi:heme oxygenase